MTPASTDPVSRFYVSQGLRLHFVDWGNPGAPPLLLLHGGLDHCRSWDWVAAELRRDYHVIAPDLRGHGDSQWSPDGSYAPIAHVYDLAEIIRQQGLAPLRIVAHSFGGNIALRYAGAYPEKVEKLVIIEGLGPPPAMAAERARTSVDQRLRDWIDAQVALTARQPRRYASIEQAMARMQATNARLGPAQVRHLTEHGSRRNADGSFSWKYDNRTRPISPVDLAQDELRLLWRRITCPTLLVNGRDSWAPDPAGDGSFACFRDARVAMFEEAGHWVHHDRLAGFLAEVQPFLA